MLFSRILKHLFSVFKHFVSFSTAHAEEHHYSTRDDRERNNIDQGSVVSLTFWLLGMVRVDGRLLGVLGVFCMISGV